MAENGLLKNYIVSCHVDKKLQQMPPASEFDCMIQAGAALTDKRICKCNDLDDCANSISDRNDRYSEGTAMYWIGQHPETDYIGIAHYRRRLSLTDPKIREYLSDGVDVITSEPVDLGLSVEEDFRKHHYSKDWDLFLDILKRRAPEDYDLASRIYSGSLFHGCNIGIYRTELYHAFCEWAFPILDDFYRESPVKTDVYQHRDVGFIAERLTHLYVTKLKEEGRRIIEVPILSYASDPWDCTKECDLEDADAVFQTCSKLYRERQITKSCMVLGAAMKGKAGEDRKLSRLSEVFISGILERQSERRTMHEYLPQELRKDPDTLMEAYTGLRKVLHLYLDTQDETGLKMLMDYVALTHFGKTVLRRICEADRIEKQYADALEMVWDEFL